MKILKVQGPGADFCSAVAEGTVVVGVHARGKWEPEFGSMPCNKFSGEN